MNNTIKTVTGFTKLSILYIRSLNFSAAAATILGHIIPSSATDNTNMAQEASFTRMYAAFTIEVIVKKDLNR
jgi:hypothetical protein